MLDNLFPQIDFVSFSMLLISIDLRYRLNDTHFFFDMDSFSSIIFKIGLFIALNTFQTHTNTHNTLSHYTIFIKSFKSISPKKRYYVYLEEFCFVENGWVLDCDCLNISIIFPIRNARMALIGEKITFRIRKVQIMLKIHPKQFPACYLTDCIYTKENIYKLTPVEFCFCYLFISIRSYFTPLLDFKIIAIVFV